MYRVNAAGSFARMDSKAPTSKTSRARASVDGEMDGVGVKALSFKRVSLACESRGRASLYEEAERSFWTMVWRSRSDILRDL